MGALAMQLYDRTSRGGTAIGVGVKVLVGISGTKNARGRGVGRNLRLYVHWARSARGDHHLGARRVDGEHVGAGDFGGPEPYA